MLILVSHPNVVIWQPRSTKDNKILDTQTNFYVSISHVEISCNKLLIVNVCRFWHVSKSSFYYLWGQPFQNPENSVIHSGWTRGYHDVSIILACPINRTNVRCMLTTCIIMHHQDFFGPIKDKIENIFHKMDIHPSLHPGNLT